MGRAAKLAGTAIAAGVLGGLGAAVASAISFDKAMRNVNSIAKLSEAQFQRLSKSVLGLSKATGQGPKTLAEGLYDIVSSGFKASDGLKILQASAKAATAGLTDTATSTKAVVAVLNAYHQGADQATHVSDVLFETVNKGVLNFQELASQIGDVLPIAANLGVPLEDIGAALATITLHGVSAAEASTQLKQLLTSILKPSQDLSKEIKAMGFASGEAALKQLGLEGVLKRLTEDAKGSTAAFANWFPNVRAMNGALGLTGKNIASLHDNLVAMRGSQGATQAAFAEQGKSIAFQWQRAKASLTAAAIPIGQLLFPALAKAAAKVGEFAQSIQSHMPEIRQEFGDIASVVGTIADELGRFGTSAGGSSLLLGGLAAAATAGGILKTRGAIAAVGLSLGRLGPYGTIAAIGVGLITGAFFLAARQGSLFEKEVDRIKDALSKTRNSAEQHTRALILQQQAQINVSTTGQQMSAAQLLVNRTIAEYGRNSVQAKTALLGLKQTTVVHKGAILDLRDANRAVTSTEKDATEARKKQKQAVQELTDKANGLVNSMRTMLILARRGSQSFDDLVRNMDPGKVKTYADTIAEVSAAMGDTAVNTNNAYGAVVALIEAFGRIPTVKDVQVFIHTTNTLTTVESNRAKQHAAGGVVEGPRGVGQHAIVGEDGPEMIIPLSGSRRPRALALLSQTAQMLGVARFAQGGLVGGAPHDLPLPKIRRPRRHRSHHPGVRVKPTSDAARQAYEAVDEVNQREADLQQSYDLLGRKFGIADADLQFTVPQDVAEIDTHGDPVLDFDGNPVLTTIQVRNEQAIAQRAGELDQLIASRQQMLALVDEEKKRLQQAIVALRKAIAKLQQAIAEQRAKAAEETRAAAAEATTIGRLNRQIDAERRKKKPDEKLIARLTTEATVHGKEQGRHKMLAGRHLAEVGTLASTIHTFAGTDIPALQQNLGHQLPFDREGFGLDIDELRQERKDLEATTSQTNVPVSVSGTGLGSGLSQDDSGLVEALRQEIGKLNLALGIQQAQLPIIGSFARGVLTVPDTGLAMLHRGEQVVTANQAAARGGDPVQVVVEHHYAPGMEWLADFVDTRTRAPENIDVISHHIGRSADMLRRGGSH